MEKKKTYLAAIVLLLVFVVGGAIAYFTDKEEKTNTFTIGNVDINLTEEAWDALTDTDDDGIPDVAEDMMPNETVAKDPTVTNNSTKNPAFVFVQVDVPCVDTGSPATPTELFTYTTNTGWTELSTTGLPVACTSGGTATHVYYYGSGGTLTELAAQASTPAVFDNVTLLDTLEGNETGLDADQEVVVTGYGIQTEGLASTTPADVWGEF